MLMKRYRNEHRSTAPTRPRTVTTFVPGSRCRVERHEPTGSPNWNQPLALDTDSAHPTNRNEEVSKLTPALDTKALLRRHELQQSERFYA